MVYCGALIHISGDKFGFVKVTIEDDQEGVIKQYELGTAFYPMMVNYKFIEFLQSKCSVLLMGFYPKS